MTPAVRIRPGTSADCATILDLIRALAEFEKLAHEVVATEEKLRATLFGDKPSAEVLIAEIDDNGSWKNAGFALFFTSYSTFLAKPGLYLEDLFVKPELRSRGIGRKLLEELARVCIARNYGRMEWSVLDWNQRAWDFYKSLGAEPKIEWTIHRLMGPALKALASSAEIR